MVHMLRFGGEMWKTTVVGGADGEHNSHQQIYMIGVACAKCVRHATHTYEGALMYVIGYHRIRVQWGWTAHPLLSIQLSIGA